MGGLDSSVSPSNLICREDGTRLDGDDDDEEEEDEGLTYLRYPFLSETEDEYVETLASRECSFESRSPDESAEAMEWLRCTRSVSVRWILRMKACFGFGSRTAYQAVNYFDRFLALRTVDEGKIWALRLLSVACLSLAAKMEECRAPALSEFQIEGCHFGSNAIQRMELLVLSTLGWRMSPVTPFSYLGHFASKLRCEDLLSRAIGFIVTVIEVMNSVDHRPSTVAAAAILAASDQMLAKPAIEAKISIISLPESLETDRVFACYSLMIQETQKEKLEVAKITVSADRSANSVDVIDTTSSADPRFKRRRLESPDSQ